MSCTLLLLAAALTLPCSNAANAATSTQTYNIPSQLIGGPISNSTLTFPAGTEIISMPFERFDTSLGTLDSVDWEYEINFVMEGNLGAGGGSISGSLGGPMYLDPAGDAGLGNFHRNSNGNGDGVPAGPLAVGYSVQWSENLSAISIGPHFDFLSALGGGQHQIDWLFDDESSLQASNASDVTLTLLDGHSTLTFNFTPAVVPEPTSLLLIGLAIASALGLRWRR